MQETSAPLVSDQLARCRPWLENALARTEGAYEWPDILDGLATGHMQFWPAPHGAMITQVVESPRLKTLHVFLAGGDLDQVLDMIPSLEAFAAFNDCVALTMDGRRGWERVLKDWTRTSVVMKKEIPHE